MTRLPERKEPKIEECREAKMSPAKRKAAERKEVIPSFAKRK